MPLSRGGISSGRRQNKNILGEFLRFFGAAAFALFLIGSLYYYNEKRTYQHLVSASENTNIALARGAIQSSLNGALTDLNFLVDAGEDLLATRAGSNFLLQVTSLFNSMIVNHPEYDQIRLLDEHGREVTRVNNKNGQAYGVPESHLQGKGDRYYFRKAWPLDRNQIYVSPLDLNIEQGEIEQPYKPMIRIARPVYDQTHQKRFLLVMNYLGDHMIKSFQSASANIADHVSLVNNRGYWISHPGGKHEWGFMFGQTTTMASLWPEIWHQISTNETGQSVSKNGLFSYATVRPLSGFKQANTGQFEVQDSELQWIIAAHLENKDFSTLPGLTGILSVYAGILIMLCLASYLIALYRVRHREAVLEAEFEQRFRSILERMDLLAVGVDIQGSIRFCNQALLDATGRKLDEVLGKNWFSEFVQKRDRAHCEQVFQQLLDLKPIGDHHEHLILCRDGSRILVNWSDTVTTDKTGQVLGLTFIGENVTESRDSEEKLKKLSLAVEQSPSSVMIVNADIEIEYVNPKFSQLTGYSFEEVVGKNPRILKSEQTTREDYRVMWEKLSAGDDWYGVFRNRKKNGEIYWESARISCIRNNDGAITHYIAVKEDITEKVSLENRFRSIFESAPNAMLLIDANGIVLMANSEVENCFGYRPDELVNENFDKLVPQQIRSEHRHLQTEFMAENRLRKMGLNQSDVKGLRKDGAEIPVEVGLSTVKTDDDQFVLCTITDIGERVKLQNELDLRNQEIAHANTLATVGRMANMVAHDLRNPLSSVKMGLQILSKNQSEKNTDEETEICTIALEQVHYMERIMVDMLSYSREIGLQREWIQLDKFIEASILLSQRQIDQNRITVKTWFQPGLPTLNADPHKLRQVFSNLISNAIQAVETVVDRKPTIVVSTFLELGKDFSAIRVEVSDNGAGLDDDTASQLMEPFYTTRTKGTGLGLAIVKRIVDAHGGTIDLKNNRKFGACATVVLPTVPLSNTVRTDTAAKRDSDPRQTLYH